MKSVWTSESTVSMPVGIDRGMNALWHSKSTVFMPCGMNRERVRRKIAPTGEGEKLIGHLASARLQTVPTFSVSLPR